MDFKIQVSDLTKSDLPKLARLVWQSRKASPLWTPEQTQARFQDYLQGSLSRWPGTKVVSAHQGEKLLGWLGLISEDPLLYELWRWHPFILPDEDQDAIAIALLRRALGIAREGQAQSVEVCCHFQEGQLTAEVERYFQNNHQSWYEEVGLDKSDEALYLVCPAGKIKIAPPAPIPEAFAIREYQPQYIPGMYACYQKAFSSGQDRSFLNKTAEQKKSWFYDYLENELNQQASQVLLKDGSVKGFTLVQTRQRVGDVHLALIAVAPGHQDQGWGRKLIGASIQAANLGPEAILSVGVDLSNEIAYQLYRSLGFEIRTKMITHLWKNS